jgi:hypothetical protein
LEENHQSVEIRWKNSSIINREISTNGGRTRETKSARQTEY